MKRHFRKIALRVAPILGYMLMRFFWFTSTKRFHIEGEITQSQSVVICWHGELMMSPQAYRHFHKKHSSSGIISRHFDGEIIARVLGYFSIDGLRGSSSKGATQVLREALRALKKGDDLLVTPDGPRGPRHQISDGAIALAHKAKVPLLIVNYLPHAYWQVSSWDKFVIPKPFGTIDFYLENISIEGLDMETARKHITDKMLQHTVI